MYFKTKTLVNGSDHSLLQFESEELGNVRVCVLVAGREAVVITDGGVGAGLDQRGDEGGVAAGGRVVERGLALAVPQLQQPGVPRQQQPGHLGVACKYITVKLNAFMQILLPWVDWQCINYYFYNEK